MNTRIARLTRATRLTRAARAARVATAAAALLALGMGSLPAPARAAEHLRAPYLVFPVAPEATGTSSLGPTDVAAGDLNGDGRADLAVVCRDGFAINAGTTLSILLSEPNPTLPLLGTAVPYGDTFGPNNVALGDVSGDGLLDVVTTEAGSNSVSVFTNRGGGLLGVRRFYSVSSAPSGLAVRDLNADGRADVVAIAGTSVIVFLAGSVPGTLLAPTVYSVSGFAMAVAIGPVDGDGVPDVVAATRGPNTLAIFHGVGNGTFTAAGAPAILYDPSGLDLADMTGNGTLEAVVASGTFAHVTVYGNDGPVPFSSAIGDRLMESSPMDVVVRDFTGDGVNDAAVPIQIGNGGSFRTGALLPGDGAGGFQAAAVFDFGPFLEAIAAGDLNGDGRLDLAACGTGQPSELKFQRAVNVVLQGPAGGFGIGSIYRAVTNDIASGKVQQADMDRDGKIDLIVAGANNSGQASVTIRPGLGDGAWDPGFEFIVSGDNNPTALPGDVNRDGKIDLVVTRVSSGSGPSIVSYLGNGNGTIVPLGSSLLTGQTGLAVGDLDRDGRPDVLTADATTHELVLYRGHGDGNFFFSWATPPTASGPDRAEIGDLNRDGAPDIVATFPGAGTYALLNNGNGTFGSLLLVTATALTVTIEDVNEDGFPDLLGSTSAATQLYRGNGNGTFQNPIALQGPGPQSGSAKAIVSDVNRDGRPDVIFDTAESFSSVVDSKLTVLLGNGSPNLGARSAYGVGRRARGLLLVDANRDGRGDVVSMEEDWGFGGSVPWLLTLLGNGSPATFDFPASHLDTPTSTPPFAMVAADFTRDGRPDVVVTRSDGGSDVATLMTGNGDGTFLERISNVMPAEPAALATGDLNRDGIPDLAIACGAGDAVVVQLGTPFDTLSVPMTVAAGLGYEFSDIAIGDFNRDGKPDLAAASAATSFVLVFLGVGDGTFGAPLAASTGSWGPISIAVGDLNRDGIPDIAAALGTGIAPDAIGVLLGVGDGTFQTVRPYTVGATPNAIVMADLSRDGVLDVAVTRTGLPGSRFVTVLHGVAGGGFGSPLSFPIPGNAPDLAAADIDGDGVLDLLATNGFGTTSFAFLHGLGGATYAQDTDYFLGDSPYALAVADFNRDGRLDIAGTPSAESKVVVVTSSPSTISAVVVEPGAPAPPAPRLTVRPNPATGRATLAFHLPTAGHARVDLFDARGRRVARLFDGGAEGDVEVRWEGRAEGGGRAAAGIYFAKLTTGRSTVTRRVVWVR